MLDNQTINELTAQAKPVAYKTLRSYIRWAPSVRVRQGNHVAGASTATRKYLVPYHHRTLTK